MAAHCAEPTLLDRTIHDCRRVQVDVVSGDDGIRCVDRSLDHDHLQPGVFDPGRRFLCARFGHGHERPRHPLARGSRLCRPVRRFRLLCARVDRWRRRQARGGDGIVARFEHLLPYLLLASVFGGLLTLALLQFRTAPLPPWLARQDWVERLHRRDGGVPYGIALAAAALAIYPHTAWMA